HQPRLVVDRVLLKVGLPLLLVADGPGVRVADRVGPRAERHAPVRQVMVFLDRGVELADGPREPAGGKAGEVVPEELIRPAGRAPRGQREETHQGAADPWIGHAERTHRELLLDPCETRSHRPSCREPSRDTDGSITAPFPPDRLQTDRPGKPNPIGDRWTT